MLERQEYITSLRRRDQRDSIYTLRIIGQTLRRTPGVYQDHFVQVGQTVYRFSKQSRGFLRKLIENDLVKEGRIDRTGKTVIDV
ncbi:MAG: hypothetical protein KJ718_02055 [Nanoarchaeota archaeon]|nr:hypothetical protein [Nanoarchaeota archaeon]MBU1051318.1 hypothetical protein [Nanoarchaeota archaeon]MBU1988454.1 hypothetical protein [Nanoarchaeota archaeon]